MILGELLRAYTLNSFPVFRCPTCCKGVLRIDEESLLVREPTFSQSRRNEEGHYDPLDGCYRFQVQFICNRASCKEIVSLIGDSRIDVDVDHQGEAELLQYYRPRAFFPAPVLIALPKSTPQKVAGLIKAASSVAWSDFNAAANRLRVCAEVLLDELGVSREDFDTLNKRIKRLGQAFQEHNELLTALRYVGNVGSHGEEVTRQVLINSFQLFEHMLEELYSGRKEKMQQMAKNLIETKGRGR